MAVIQLNPVGMLATDEGYISSISVRNAGGTVVYTPDAGNQIGVTGNAVGAAMYSRFAGGGGNAGGNQGQNIKTVSS